MPVVAYKLDEAYDFDTIAKLLKASVAPESWQDYGGSCFVERVSIATSSDIFVAVGQTTVNHVLVKEFFESLQDLNLHWNTLTDRLLVPS